jgi:hypothetical protein
MHLPYYTHYITCSHLPNLNLNQLLIKVIVFVRGFKVRLTIVFIILLHYFYFLHSPHSFKYLLPYPSCCRHRHPPGINGMLTAVRTFRRGLGRWLEVPHYCEKIAFVDVIRLT